MASLPEGIPNLIRIGDLARLTGKTVRAIHLYEELGLLKPTSRSSGGFRLYEHRAVERVRWIDLLHSMGFSLQEMRDLLRSWWSSGMGPAAMEELRRVFRGKLEETRESIARHRRIEGEIEKGLAYLETCRVCATPEAAVDGCARCNQDHGMAEEPALVAGIVFSPEPHRGAGRTSVVRIEDIR
jgi:DNA-binding transcriptional MerR regulator